MDVQIQVFFTSILVGDVGQIHALAALPPEKEPPVLADRSLCGPQSRSGRYRIVKILDLTGTQIRTPSVVQTVTSSYTDCATGALKREVLLAIN
jgi:hypothetical protein